MSLKDGTGRFPGQALGTVASEPISAGRGIDRVLPALNSAVMQSLSTRTPSCVGFMGFMNWWCRDAVASPVEFTQTGRKRAPAFDQRE
jgi:hypothetical protein